MDARAFKERLKRRQPVIGTWSHLPNPTVVEIIGAAGLDFIVFDLEHGPHSFGDLPALYLAAESRGLLPITRVPGPDNSNILRCLDSGTKGVMVPHVADAEAAARALESMVYGPSSRNRGVATLTRASLFDGRNERAYLDDQNALITSILMVEDGGALDDLDAICALPGLDVLFIGIYDLSQSLGLRGSLDDPGFQRLFTDAVRRITDHGVTVGCYAASPVAAKRLLDLGVGFVTLCVDGAMLRRSYEQALAELASLT